MMSKVDDSAGSHPKALDDFSLSACDQEPIHIPGAIQPHGMLISFDAKTFKIDIVSANSERFFGKPAEALLSLDLLSLFTPHTANDLKNALPHEDFRLVNPITLQVDRTLSGAKSQTFDGILSRHNGRTLLELELTHDVAEDFSFFALDHSIRQSVLSIQGAKTVLDACQSIVMEIRRITGFDRVLAYEFDPRWNGVVIAEDKAKEMDSYLGQRFPASDIPAQARKLYESNWLRLIANADYEPVPLVPPSDPRTQKPIDLSFSVLRSVSPVHLQYMRNMNTAASMSISVIKEDKLWGLISCHHPDPHYVSFKVRSVCEFLGQIFATQLTSIETREREGNRIERKAILTTIDRSLRSAPDLQVGFASSEELLHLTHSTGAALSLRNKVHTFGASPTIEQVTKIVAWLERSMKDEILITDQLALLYPPAKEFEAIASGLLAMRVTDDPELFVLWFRPELVKTLEWAGKPVKDESEASIQLHPRKSFAKWQEVERGRSLPFREIDLEAVGDLRNVILLKLVSKANKDLEESNGELESFATIVAHDLKEPLRGMRNYTSFVLEDCIDIIDPESQRRLTAAVALGGDLENLLTSLYDYSRLGRVEFSVDEVSLQAVLESVLSRLTSLIETSKAEIIIPRALPILVCDKIRVGEIFYNLISNAIKYNQSEPKKVEITFAEKLENHPTVFCVRDNGIGIDPRHHQEIFKIFKRLHARQEYPGGTGTGLAIVKRLIDRHRGEIKVESAPGQGSAFLFTLSAD